MNQSLNALPKIVFILSKPCMTPLNVLRWLLIAGSSPFPYDREICSHVDSLLWPDCDCDCVSFCLGRGCDRLMLRPVCLDQHILDHGHGRGSHIHLYDHLEIASHLFEALPLVPLTACHYAALHRSSECTCQRLLQSFEVLDAEARLGLGVLLLAADHPARQNVEVVLWSRTHLVERD